MTLSPGAEDAAWMRRALRLAARGFTPPNPMVGCVLVKDGQVVGEGYHLRAGDPHAEAVALQAAGERARGATAYVSLEPCAHFGRTPPCSSVLISAGVTRVVAATEDPDPRTRGAGLREIRAAGVAVSEGVLGPDARKLNEAFFLHRTTGLPFVTLKAAITLDGKTATRTGDSRWITGPRARAYVHRLRARSGAVLCGVGTVLTDDPLLTARFRGCPRQPIRIVLDSHLRTPVHSKLVATARDSPVWICASVHADNTRAQALIDAGVEIIRLPTDKRYGVELATLLPELGRRAVISVLVEGGGTVHASFLDLHLANRLLWFISPKIAGGRDAPTSVEGEGAEHMADAIELALPRVKRLGQDLLIETAPFRSNDEAQ